MSFFDAIRGHQQEVQNMKDIITVETLTNEDILEVERTDTAKSCDMWNQRMEAVVRLDSQGLIYHDGETWRARR